jgi:thiamine pyrophosphate-dependent acetolactate synthase large subunit-like protein
MNASELLLERLAEWDVTVSVGYPGEGINRVSGADVATLPPRMSRSSEAHAKNGE